MTLLRPLKWLASVFFVLLALAILLLAVFDWNWLRGPIERMALDKTGRALTIGGNLVPAFGWPLPRIRAGAVRFANPSWASEQQMVAAEAVEITIDLPQLLRGRIVFPEVRLRRPVIHLEQGGRGQKNWLLDVDQQDEAARILIGRLMLDEGVLGYDDPARKTRIRATLSTSPATAATPSGSIDFTAQGQYEGLPLAAHGKGGPVLGLRDETVPYPLQVELSIGKTGINAEGTITSLLKFSAVDMQLRVHGRSLAQLFPLLGIAFPETPPYTTDGRLVHTETSWRYEKFSGRFGGSDISGTIRVDSAGKRPAMKADLVSRSLDLADLGPLIGARPGSVQAATQAAPPPAQAAAPTPTRARVLPELPFKTERWGSVDAEVTLQAGSIRAEALPLENLLVHLSLRDSVLKLDPLDFGVAGGQLKASVSLDGRQLPIKASAQLRARKIQIARLLPEGRLGKTGIGQINGQFDLSGHGSSVRQMLATSNGKVGLSVVGGQISKLTMERAGLHVWEILALNVTGDRLVKLRCGVADFDVREGVMDADALVFDTEITTLIGTGSIDLGEEKLALAFNQKTKATSPLALRSPIRVGGTLASPDVSVDKGRVAARALGAVALGMVNPLLMLIPLVDAGPGKDSDCRQLIQDARALPQSGRRKAATRTP